MSGVFTDHTAPTRRDCLKYGGTVVGGSLLAGCADESGANASRTGTDAGSRTADATPAVDSTPTANAPYAVSMEPAGEVEFESVPETWLPYGGDYADMGVALGQAEGLVGVGGANRYYTYPYDELPGVDVDRGPLEANDPGAADMSKEIFYELDADVHVMDPEMLVNWFGWSTEDVEEIAGNVGPFLGNLVFRREDEWHDYRYYTLYEAFEKVAELFQEVERFRAFESLHEEFVADVQTRLPPADERPNVLLVYEGSDEPEAFSPYRLNDRGTSKKQWRDLGVSDALAGTGIHGISTTDRGRIDYETMLEIDPDVIVLRAHERKSAAEFRDTVLSFMREHPVGGELTAVRNGRVYRGGHLYQGPIHNLFLTERGAKQLYPEVFGEVTGDAELFDRDRVASITNGNV